VFINIANLDVRLDNQLSEHHLQPMIMVFPDGRIGGSTYSDSEWANTSSGAYDSYVVNVVSNVDHRFSTLADRQGRVIGGFSAGAYGAINVALHHLQTFGSVEVWSGYFVQTRTGVFAHATRAELDDNSPLHYIAGLHRTIAANPVRVYMFVGRDDGSSAQIVPMARALRRAGASVAYAIYPGGHDWQVWYPRLNQMLMLASHDFATPLPGGHVRARRHAAAAARSPRQRRRARAQLVLAPPVVQAQAPARHHHHQTLVAALLLALLSSAAINLGFLLQHRGLADRAGDDVPLLRAMLGSRTWIAGQAIGWTGFVAQLVAVALAPLSVVQAFAAGGLAVSLPVAARAFGYPITRRQLLAILLIGVGLASLPIALHSHSHLHARTLVEVWLVALPVAAALGVAGRPSARAIAAGMFYGAADAAIKAASIAWHGHVASLLSGWTVLAAVATFCGFVCFQAALRRGGAVASISLMNVFATLVALVLGVVAFGESLGTTPAASIAHLLAIAVVLACVPVLATGQEQIATGQEQIATGQEQIATGQEQIATGQEQIADGTAVVVTPESRSVSRRHGSVGLTLRRTALGIAAIASLLVSVLVGAGLLYGLRGLGWLAAGPGIRDALPLLQLPGFDGQPLARVLVAFLAGGAVFGATLIRTAPTRRAAVAGVAGLLVLLVASDAAFAVTHNLRFGPILWQRAPTIGCWVQALALAIGAAIPRSPASLRVPRRNRVSGSPIAIPGKPA
jgi:predicted esterase